MDLHDLILLTWRPMACQQAAICIQPQVQFTWQLDYSRKSVPTSGFSHGHEAWSWGLQAAAQLSLQQQSAGLAKRELYWCKIGCVLWRRKQLLKKLQEAAVRFEEEAEPEFEMWLTEHTLASIEVQIQATKEPPIQLWLSQG